MFTALPMALRLRVYKQYKCVCQVFNLKVTENVTALPTALPAVGVQVRASVVVKSTEPPRGVC